MDENNNILYSRKNNKLTNTELYKIKPFWKKTLERWNYIDVMCDEDGL